MQKHWDSRGFLRYVYIQNTQGVTLHGLLACYIWVVAAIPSRELNSNFLFITFTIPQTITISFRFQVLSLRVLDTLTIYTYMEITEDLPIIWWWVIYFYHYFFYLLQTVNLLGSIGYLYLMIDISRFIQFLVSLSLSAHSNADKNHQRSYRFGISKPSIAMSTFFTFTSHPEYKCHRV